MSKKKDPQEQLEAIHEQLIDIGEDVDKVFKLVTAIHELRDLKMEVERKRSTRFFYSGVLLGSLLGVVGNFYVSLWFRPLTFWNFIGLAISSVILFFTAG